MSDVVFFSAELDANGEVHLNRIEKEAPKPTVEQGWPTPGPTEELDRSCADPTLSSFHWPKGRDFFIESDSEDL